MTEQQVTTKDPKKIEEGKRLAEYNHKKREEWAKGQKIENEPKLTLSQYYGVGAVIAIGALGILGYCIYQSKKGDTQPKEGDVTSEPQANKFEME